MALDLLNNRSVRALSLTKGIGPEAAKLINNHRKKNGILQSLDDLKNIQGLKATRLLKRVQSQEGNLFLLMKYHYPLLDLFTEEERKVSSHQSAFQEFLETWSNKFINATAQTLSS